MRDVIEISAHRGISRISIDDGHHECSVCGEWKPTESYSDPVKLEEMKNSGYTGIRTRNNCFECYNSGDLNAIKEVRNRLIKDNNALIISMKTKISEEIYFKGSFQNDSVTIAEMMEILKTMDPNSRITIGVTTDNEEGTDYYKPTIQTNDLAGNSILVFNVYA